MPNAAIARPFGEQHFPVQARPDPGVAAPAGRAPHERRGRARQRTELLADRLERSLVESGADLRDVDQLPPLVEAQVQGAEMRPRALGHRVAADHELLPQLTLDL